MVIEGRSAIVTDPGEVGFGAKVIEIHQGNTTFMDLSGKQAWGH
jgi:hypothetical protein